MKQMRHIITILFSLLVVAVIAQPTYNTTLNVGTGSGGTSADIAYESSILASNVTMTTASTWYDGPSVTITSGVWMIMGQIAMETGASYGYSRITDKTNHYSLALTDAGIDGTIEYLHLHALVSVEANATIYLQGMSGQSNRTILASILGGITSTQITAIKLSE